MSSLITAYKMHENTRIGSFSEKNMLINYEKDEDIEPPYIPDFGDIRLIVQVSYDKDPSATIASTADKSLLTIKNLANDTQMNVHNSTNGHVNTYVKTINGIRKGLFMNYTGLSYDIGSYNDGIYDTTPFGATSICIFSNAHPNMRNVTWKKFSSAGFHGAHFGISKRGGNDLLYVQFAGIDTAQAGETIPFNFNDTTTDINYLAFASVKETATNTYLITCELWSFTDKDTPITLVQAVSFTKNVDLSTANTRLKDHYHSGIDRYTDTSDLAKSSILVFESRFYIGCIEGELKNYVITDLLNYWRVADVEQGLPAPPPDLTYQINYQFAETISDLTLSTGIEEYHQNAMIKLQPSQVLSKTFADNEVLIRENNLNLFSIRVKVYSALKKWRIDGINSWFFQYDNGTFTFSDTITSVVSTYNLIKQFNDFTCVYNVQAVYFFVNGVLHDVKNNTLQYPLPEWSELQINNNATSENIYELIHIKLGINEKHAVIYDNYIKNSTNFFTHISLSTDHVLSGSDYLTTLIPDYVSEPNTFVKSISQTKFKTPNKGSVEVLENSPTIITNPDIVNRQFDFTYNLQDNTKKDVSVVDTIYDNNQPDKNDSGIPPYMIGHEFLLENTYRVQFYINSSTQGFVVPIEQVQFIYNNDSRLTNGSFTTTINPIVTLSKPKTQTVNLNHYAGVMIPLGYYDFTLADRDVKTLNAPETTIRYIYQTGGTNIVNSNTKQIARYRQPYLKLISRQDERIKEQITRYLYIEKQDYSIPIYEIVIKYHVKTTNLTLGYLFPRNSTTSTVSTTIKPGYDVNERITFTFNNPQIDLQDIFTIITTQNTQIINEDDFYMEIVSINQETMIYYPSLYIEPIIYTPTLRFSYTAIQVNFQVNIDIFVNKNEENVTAFIIKLQHAYGALINYNDFAIPGFSSITQSDYISIFTFNGSHFSGQNERLIQLIVGNNNPYEKVFYKDIKIEIESFTLETSNTIINNPLIEPEFTFNTLSYIGYEDYSFEILDNDLEKAMMNVYLYTNSDVKTELDFWLSFESLQINNAFIPGTEKFNFNKDLWNFTITPETKQIFSAGFDGFRVITNKIPILSLTKHQLLTVEYTRYRTQLLNNGALLSLINIITPPTSLLPYPVNESISRSRIQELIVRPQQALSSVYVTLDFLCSANSVNLDFIVEIWYDANRLTYNSVSTIFSKFSQITVTSLTGNYKGFTQCESILIETVGNESEIGSMDYLLEIIMNANNDYEEINNNDFAIKLISTSNPSIPLKEDTIIPPFQWIADVNITGQILQETEGVNYTFRTTLNKSPEYPMIILYDIFYNANALISDSINQSTTLSGVTWPLIRKITKTFHSEYTNTDTHNNRFEMKFYREGLTNDDFRIVIRSVTPQVIKPSTLTFVPTSSINSFTYTPQFQLRLSPSVSGDTITVTVILEKDSRAVRNFEFHYVIDDDRTISSSLPRGNLLEIGTYNTTDQFNSDFSMYGLWSNTNKTIINYTNTVDGVGAGIANLPIYYFTVKRRQANYLISRLDFRGDFIAYEAFHTPTQYFNRQYNGDRDDVEYIKPELYLTNVYVSTTSLNNHQLSFVINHPDISTNITYRIFYRNMFINLGGSFLKTTINANPYETPIGFVNGYEFTPFASTGYSTTIYQNFQTDLSMSEYITQDDFKIQIMDISYSLKGEFSIPTPFYTPTNLQGANYLEPFTYNLRIVPNRDIFDISVPNEKNYTIYNGDSITSIRAGVRSFDDNIIITPTNAKQSNSWFNLITQSTNPMLEFPITYDYTTNGLDVMMSSVFKINSMNDGNGAVIVMGHQDYFHLQIEKTTTAGIDAYGYIKVVGIVYNATSQVFPISFGALNAVKVRIVETSTNSYTIDIRHWVLTSSLIEQPSVSYTITRTIANPLIPYAIIHKSLPEAPTFGYNPGVNFAYSLEIAQASYRIGRFTIAEWNDTYFVTQLDTYTGGFEPYALLDMRQQEAEWQSEWDSTDDFGDFGGFGYLYSTIGQSRGLALLESYLTKKNFTQTGSQIWGNDMRVSLIIVFRTNVSVENLCLFLHGEEKSPPNHQLIVNRNGYDNSITIELNENNYSLQQQHLNNLDWYKPQYEYLYYAQFLKQQTAPWNAYEKYNIKTRLIGLNNSVNETFNSSGLPAFFQGSISSSTDFTPNLYIGKTIFDGVYGGFVIGYMKYFEYVSDTHSDIEIERVRRDWETIY